MNPDLFKWVQQDDCCHVNQDLSVTSYHDPNCKDEMEFIINRIKSLYAAGGAVETFTAVDVKKTFEKAGPKKSDAQYMFDNYFHPIWIRWQASHFSNHRVTTDGYIETYKVADHIREMGDEWRLWADCEGWVDERVKKTIKELKEMLYDDSIPSSYLMLEFVDEVITEIRLTKAQEDQ